MAKVMDAPVEDLSGLKEDFVTACRILANEGLSEAAFNISCRLPGDRMMVIPITSPNLVTADNVEIYGLDEAVADWKAHPAIYEARPDIGAIVHVHPPYAIAFSTVNQPFVPIHHYGAPFHGKLTMYRSPGQTGTVDRAKEIAAQLGQNRVILQQGHGSTMVGKDLREAVLLTIYLEESLKILTIAKQMGTPEPLTLEQSEKITPQILKPRSQGKAWAHYAGKLAMRQG